MTKVSAQDGKTGVEIAIIGMAIRFPGADTLEEFWQNLKDGVESLTYLSDGELIAAGVGADEFNATGYVKAGYFLEDIEYFDARFFGFNPREAELLDPQQRLFLECAWNALEDAGYDAETYKGLIGVYAGAGISRYMMFNLYSNRDSIDLFQARLGTDKDFVPTRVSYKLNLNGPSVAVLTACSTSLVAIHMACQSLLNGECDMALTGGVTIRVPQKAGYHYKEGGVLSPDGHCRAFDEQGEGIIPSSGAGLIVLKRLEDALADRDSIYAVIKGSAINNDGSLKIGYTAPSVDGQAEVIAEAQAIAGVTPDTITFVETHGTGTKLGDPVEIKALTQAFRMRTDKKNFCAVGSVKTNIGHTDTAAGVAGLIKTALSLKHKQLPPSLNFTRPNPEIDFENSPFYVNTRLCEWKNGSQPRRAGVSSFGIGGTNAHTVLEEVTEQSGSGESREHQLLVLSAKTATALETATANLATHLRAHPELNLADVAHTLQVGRRPFNHRRALVCKDVNDAIDALERLDPRQVITQETNANTPSVAFMFPGGGAQYVGMGLDLYRSEPVFRQEIDRCADLLRAEVGYDLRDALYPKEEQTAEMSARFQRTSVALPTLFSVEYALAMLWMSWTGRPEALIGHSLGEYVAACLAGVFSLEEGLSLVVTRGKLLEQLPAGSMLSVPLPESEARRLMNGKLSVAAINGPSHCVLSGPSQAITEMATVLSQQGIDARVLHIGAAGHSPMVEPILNEFLQFVKRLKLRSPEIPFISNVTGTWIRAEEITDPTYWVRHLRQTVRFGEGVRELLKDDARVLLEVGPGHTLASLVKLQTGGARATFSSLRHPYEQLSDQAFILGNLGRLWSTGVPVDWSAYYANEERRRVSLPSYPFERQRYWIAPRAEQTTPARSLAKKPDIADWFYLPVWKETVPPSAVERSEPQKYCLIFADDSGLSAHLANRLVENGWNVVSVFMGDHFEAIDDHTFTLNPRLSDDYERLLKELQSNERRLAEIIHFWSLMPSYANCSSAELLEMTQERGFYSLLFLAQALGEEVLTPLLGSAGATESFRLTYITNGLHEVTGQEELCAEKATALGPCRVIPQEYPISSQSIDVVLPAPGSKQEELLVNQLFAEVTAGSADQVVAYRGKHRWVRAFEPVRIDQQSHKPSCLREGGVYLITGGLGGVGLELAEHIAQTVPCRLILLGRSTFPARAEWEEHLAGDDRVSQQIRKLQDIERLGSEILVVSADVTDEEQLREALARAREQFGRINGVVHAAGVRPEGLIQTKTAAQAAGVLAPKVRGTRLLSELLRGDPLDFFVLCSSLRSVVGGAGMVDHAAACAYLDAFAQAQNLHNDGLVTSINWDAWGEVGQSVEFTRHLTDVDQPKARLTRPEGQEVFGRLLSRGLPQVIVSIQDLPSIAEYYSGVSTDSKAEEAEDLFLARQTHARPELRSLYVAPRDGVEQTLAKIWEESLGLERVGIHDNFFELGGDSIVSIRIIARANQAGLRLTPKQVFQHQTIAQLAAVAGKVLNVEAEQGVVVGPIPLTPIQSWFFENEIADQHRISLSTLLEARPALAAPALEQTLQKLWTHHDALRLRFYQDEGQWQQFNLGIEGVEQRVPFTHVDLSPLTQDEQTATVERVATEVLASLDLQEGRLMQVVLFDLGSPATNLLLIVIHHLAIDMKSWRILFADLQTAYQQLTSGEPLELAAKTSSFKQWAESLTQRAQSETLEQGLSAWVMELEQPLAPLPRDYVDGVNTEASVSKVSIELPESETSVLLHEVPKVYKTEVEDALLTALAQTFAQWTNESALLVETEADGRESESETLDLSRTIGWFTTLMPVRLELSGRTNDAGEALKTIKEQLRGVTSHGHDYGLVRYLKQGGPIVERMRLLPRPEVNFIYLGQIDQGVLASSAFRPVKNFRGRSSEGTRSHLLNITVTIFNNQLHADWSYSRNVHRRETIETLAGDFITALRAIIAHCLSPDAGGYTPSDFPEAQLSQKELDTLISEIAGPGGFAQKVSN